jgi:hypothetical protein
MVDRILPPQPGSCWPSILPPESCHRCTIYFMLLGAERHPGFQLLTILRVHYSSQAQGIEEVVTEVTVVAAVVAERPANLVDWSSPP